MNELDQPMNITKRQFNKLNIYAWVYGIIVGALVMSLILLG